MTNLMHTCFILQYVYYQNNSTKTNAQQNIKICNAKQVNQYKNTKIKMYKNNAAIWCNKTCSIKQLIPTYVNIRVNVNSPRCQRTKQSSKLYFVILDHSLVLRVTIPDAASMQFNLLIMSI